ncbi:MAG: 5'/3'-nucleotidase SurE [Chlamydiae bacterium]|nr:5'/3'-nucleotidase SurE [Chlamydiota bacterium]
MTKRPHILITNDDGVNAPGIKHLWQALIEFADVTVIAPATEQSATSLSITLRDPLQIDRIHWKSEFPVWTVNGTPADCIKLGLSMILKKKPDLIVSGINRGSNAGRNVLYSGTVAATIESVLQGVPAIAFSCYDYWDTDYTMAELHVPKIIHHTLDHPLPTGTLLNVNFPSKEAKEIKGFKMTRQGKEFWAENPAERSHPAERHTYYWLGAKIAQFDEEEDCDITWLRKGYVTAVPIHIDQLTDNEHLRSRRESFEKIFN